MALMHAGSRLQAACARPQPAMLQAPHHAALAPRRPSVQACAAGLQPNSASTAARTVLDAAPRVCTTSAAGRGTLVVAEAASKTGAGATVKIVIQGRKLEVTDAIRSYVQEKITRALINVSQVIREVDVTLSARGGDTGTQGKKEQKVDVTVYTYRNGVVRVEDGEATLYAAIDIVCDKLSRKMTKTKERAIAKGKWPGRAGDKGVAKAIEEAEEREQMEEVVYETRVMDRQQQVEAQLAELNKKYPSAVRRKKVIELDPISVDEAIDSMEAVGHDFYVFRDIETDEIQVVYRRAEEGYGIILPTKRQ